MTTIAVLRKLASKKGMNLSNNVGNLSKRPTQVVECDINTVLYRHKSFYFVFNKKLIVLSEVFITKGLKIERN